MKVVVDTNVFLDAFFNTDENCNIILREERNGEFQLVMSNDMNVELLNMIKSFIHRMELNNNEIINVYTLLGNALLRAENIVPKTRFSKCQDPDDNMFFSCAIDGNANYIISRDHHIHALKDKSITNKEGKKIEILYPDEFVDKLSRLKLVAYFNNK